MKKTLALTAIFICIITSSSKAQYVDIPDSAFRSFLQYHYPACMNAQGQLDTTCNAILVVEQLNAQPFTGICENTFRNLTGLQYFKNLKWLDISGNYCLQTFPYISTLKTLSAYDCAPVALSSLPNGLKVFAADWFYFSSGDNRPAFINDNNHLPDSLEYLSLRNCYSQSPIVMPELPAGLKYLDIALVNVDSLSPLPATLEYLNCMGNFSMNTLYSLPSKLRYIQSWNCPAPRVSSLPDSLRYMYIWGLEEVPPFPPYLKFLNISVNGPTTFPPLPASLDTFIIYSGGSLTSLGRLPDSLKHFECRSTNVSSIINFPGKLQTVYLDYNPSLTTLPSFPTSLKYFQSTNTPLTNLASIATATNLTYLTISQSQLTTLPPLPASISILTCENNTLLTTLPASAGFADTIICRNNALTSLPPLSNGVNLVDCSVNQITSLPPLPDSLSELVFHYNQVSDIPALPQSIQLLGTYGNPLRCLPALPPAIFIVDLDPSLIRCIANTPSFCYFIPGRTGPFDWAWDWRGYPFWLANNIPMPLCNPTNNVSGCQSFPVISGTVFYDNNNNSIRDNNEPVKQNCRIDLSNDTYTFTNKDGYFEIAADSTASYSLSATPPNYFNTSPAEYNYNFTRYDTLVNGNFGLNAAATIDSLFIKLIPINWAARPGFPLSFLVDYSNEGTTVLSSPSINLEYDTSKLVYDSCSYPAIANGNSILVNTSSLVQGANGSFITYFRLKPTVSLEDSIFTRVTVTTVDITVIDSNKMYVRGAFDPNDKQATPQLSPSQVANGNYINYTVRFQNTGTDTAFNIVISDTLSSDLQTETLQMIASSHNCKATVKNNIAFFEFLNILLPDSNINEPKSHGFVSFRIKPQTTVAVNTTINNKAAIYFDYNAPVITNTAGTLIKDFTPIPLKLISFSAVPQNDNTVLLYWNTANEINTKYFVIEQSNDGGGFNALKNITAKGKVSNYYSANVTDANNSLVYYRLKIVDNDGSYSYSPVIKVDRRKNTPGISILTNPVKDILIISINDRTLTNTTATIINMQGAVVNSFVVKQGSQTVEVKRLPPGIYYVRTVNGSSRMIIQ